MEWSVKLAWIMIALIHATPAFSVLKPDLIEKLYQVPNEGDLGILLVHRGVLFLAVLVISIYAVFEPNARRAATLVAAISMLGFLVLYAKAGLPDGALRKIALVDLFGLLPLIWVVWDAWGKQKS